jgi:hypothetical protein
MVTRFLIAGTLAGGLVRSILNGRNPASSLQAIQDPLAVVETIRSNVSADDIYTAPQGLFVSVSSHTRLQGFGPRLGGQLLVEFGCNLTLAPPREIAY